MKKIIALVFVLVLFTGCGLTRNMDNTPTKKVENLLNKYQTLDMDVLEDLETLVAKEETFSNEQKDDYKDVIKSNYQKMVYKIKEETIDKDKAKVQTEIEVIDYSTIVSEANKYLSEHPDEFLSDSKYDESLFIDYKLKKLKDAKDKIKYTIEFTLTKVENEWVLDSLTEDMRNKLNGIY